MREGYKTENSISFGHKIIGVFNYHNINLVQNLGAIYYDSLSGLTDIVGIWKIKTLKQ